MVSTAIAQLLIDMGFNPIIAAGLSLGEYSALVTAKSFTYRDAIPLVRKRGIIMSSSVPAGKGAMSAVIGLEEERLLACCEEAEKYGMVSIANYNCPGQMVISGETEAVNIASQLAKKAGAKRVVPLSVSGPFHSLLLKPASYALAEELKNVNINPPVIPVISNVTAKPVTTSEEIRSLLIKQVYSPVRWRFSQIHDFHRSKCF